MAKSPSRDYHIKPRVIALPEMLDGRPNPVGRIWEIDCRACGHIGTQPTFRAAQLVAKHHPSPIKQPTTVKGVEINILHACTPDTRFTRLTERITHENKNALDRLADM